MVWVSTNYYTISAVTKSSNKLLKPSQLILPELDVLLAQIVIVSTLIKLLGKHNRSADFAVSWGK